MVSSLKKILIITLTLAFMAIHSSAAAEKLTVYAVNYPLQYFAERIGGEHINVVFPAPADVDPAYWMPDAPTIAAYQQADVVLLNGARYAKWLNKVTLPQSRMVNTSAGFKNQYMDSAEILTHSHGSEGQHAHESLAFTTWIDFSLAAKQAKAIVEALSRKRPDLSDIFQKNYEALENDIMALDHAVNEIVSNDRTRPLMVSHPVYDYFARRYGLNIKSVHWEPDESPGNEKWMELRTILKNHPAGWMIWEGQPNSDSAAKLKSMGIGSIVFDPCGNVPDRGDFLSIMRQNVENLKLAFE
jgi:zinc transport system substrate-binding protein